MMASSAFGVSLRPRMSAPAPPCPLSPWQPAQYALYVAAGPRAEAGELFRLTAGPCLLVSHSAAPAPRIKAIAARDRARTTTERWPNRGFPGVTADIRSI